ncbi:hypothetical protein [Methanocella arvoryzae]|uniref:Uncharacterized protein n=1 Tax=Methanocella arvoryzae (strain DSM 22066 / NBRC 105507 / MRE50) TaxID=351160 RepID=Q0W6A7_METAR|nr:hypothetical protein [Methanocella arvoryzae]CAJ36086.1 hypothetical protein RCIX694 [Methanocella arvoryzae MRE50]
MKLSKIALVLVVALSLATVAVPAGAWFGPFGITGFGFPFGAGVGTSFSSNFQSSTSFSTFGTAGIGSCGVPLGFGFGVPFGLGFGGFGLGFPFGFC